MKQAIVLLCVSLTGCSVLPVQQIEGNAYRVDCSGQAWEACLQAAQKQCVNFVEESRVTNQGSGVGSQDWSERGSVVSRVLVFRCPANAAPR